MSGVHSKINSPISTLIAITAILVLQIVLATLSVEFWVSSIAAVGAVCTATAVIGAIAGYLLGFTSDSINSPESSPVQSAAMRQIQTVVERKTHLHTLAKGLSVALLGVGAAQASTIVEVVSNVSAAVAAILLDVSTSQAMAHPVAAVLVAVNWSCFGLGILFGYWFNLAYAEAELNEMRRKDFERTAETFNRYVQAVDSGRDRSVDEKSIDASQQQPLDEVIADIREKLEKSRILTMVDGSLSEDDVVDAASRIVELLKPYMPIDLDSLTASSEVDMDFVALAAAGAMVSQSNVNDISELIRRVLHRTRSSAIELQSCVVIYTMLQVKILRIDNAARKKLLTCVDTLAGSPDWRVLSHARLLGRELRA